MTPDALIGRLTQDLRPVRPRSAWRDGAWLGAICAVELALVLLAGLARPDMEAALSRPSLWWKFAGTGVIAAAAGGVALVSLDPSRSPRPGLQRVGLLIALTLVAGAILDVLHGGHAAELAARLDWRSGLQCASKVAGLSLAPAIGLGWSMRRGAPSHADASSLAAGLGAAGCGAFVFVFACPCDDPLYIAVWYGLGCLAVVLAVSLVLPIVARW